MARAKRRVGKSGKLVGTVGAQLVKAGLQAGAATAVEAWLKKDSGGKASSALRGALPASSAPIEIISGPQVQRVILLPGTRGMRSSTPATKKFMVSMSNGPAALRSIGAPALKMKVVDSIHEDGAKLVETTVEELQKLRAAQPGLVVVPERFFDLAAFMFRVEQSAKALAGGVNSLRTVTIELISSSGGKPIAGATVVAFTDFAARTGAQGVTSSKGRVSLKLPSGVKKLDRLYIYPHATYWGSLGIAVTIPASGPLQVTLDAIDLGATDSLRHFMPPGTLLDGKGVKVGVLDTGIALHHPDLVVSGGECTVDGEPPNQFGPLGGDHGSHCAGIIAGRGTAPTGVRGVAPGAQLFSFRVFPKPTPLDPNPGASNFAIAKAIDRAVAAGCDVLNLSLGGGPSDQLTEAAISDAFNAGAVVVAAAGNDGRQPVSFPASFDLCVAVSALGRKGLFPSTSVFQGDVAPPFGTDKKNFIASFSNVGPDVDCTGPGVAVVSTVPAKAYAAMSGTSMACPAVVGFAAAMLAKKKALLNATRDAQRASLIVKELLASAKTLGFSPNLEGRGLPR